MKTLTTFTYLEIY